MKFVCRYGTQDGRVLTEIQEGNDITAIRRELERKGYHIFEIRPRSPLFQLNMPFAGIRRKKMKMPAFLAFNQELAALLRAGLPLLQGLDMMLERMEDATLRDVLTDIRDKVKSGEELSDAFASFGDMFPPLYASTLKAGERSGELEQVIRRFIRYLRLVMDAQKRVVSAMVYPSVLILLSIIMLIVMAIYVVPMFAQFYTDLKAELPLITRVTLVVSYWLRDNIVWLSISLGVGLFLFNGWRRSPAGQIGIDRLRLKLPIMGSIFLLFSLSEFCRSLATLIAGGIPFVSAFEIANGAVSNVHIRRMIAPAIDQVRQGRGFNEALDETGIFPHMSIDMIKVGEATGSLDEMLASVADYFDEQVETRVERLLSLVEPVMLVVMGLMIGLLLVSIYMPMFGALSAVNG